jgi:hypothetical protein
VHSDFPNALYFDTTYKQITCETKTLNNGTEYCNISNVLNESNHKYAAKA